MGITTTESATPPNGTASGSDPLTDIAVTLVVDVAWIAGCEAVVGIANSIHHFHRASTHAGYYYAPDGSFSVAIPGWPDSDGYEAQQQTGQDKTTVLFVPRTKGDLVFGATVVPRLTPEQADLSLDEFAKLAGDLMPHLAAAGQTPPLTQVHAEDIALGANPARLVVFRANSTDAGTGEPRYYLMYFVKTPRSAAVLSVAWPFECEKCAVGPDSALRAMDSRINPFLDSFELRNPG